MAIFLSGLILGLIICFVVIAVTRRRPGADVQRTDSVGVGPARGLHGGGSVRDSGGQGGPVDPPERSPVSDRLRSDAESVGLRSDLLAEELRRRTTSGDNN